MRARLQVFMCSSNYMCHPA